MKIIITGPKGFTDYALLERKLNQLLSKLKKPTLVVAFKEGCCNQATEYAFKKRLVLEVHRPLKKGREFFVDGMFDEMCETSKVLVSFGKDKHNVELLKRAKQEGLTIRRIE